jgi:hypothetical protein
MTVLSAPRTEATEAEASYEAMLDLVDRLVADYGGAMSAASIEQRVSRTRWSLIVQGVHDDLISATEHAVRAQLAQHVARSRR